MSRPEHGEPGLWRRWAQALKTQETGTALALFRIGIGLSTLWLLLIMAPHDRIPFLWLDRDYGGYRDNPTGSWLVELLGGATPPVVWGLYGMATIAAAALTLGIGSRLAAFLALQGVLAVGWINMHAGGSYDDLATNALWLLVFADSGATLSISCRLRTGRWTSDRLVSSWPRWLAVLQLVLMYASSGSQKLSHHWVPGGEASALYYILQQPEWQRFDMRWLAEVYPLTQVVTTVTWLWEVSAPLLLLAAWARWRGPRAGRLLTLLRRFDLRLPFVAIGIPMHVGTFLLMEVGPFSALSIAYYACVFHPDEWMALFRRLGRRPTPERAIEPGPG